LTAVDFVNHEAHEEHEENSTINMDKNVVCPPYFVNITFLSFDTTFARTILERKHCSFRAGPSLRPPEIKVKR